MLRYNLASERELERVSALWESKNWEDGFNVLMGLLTEEPGCGKAHSYLGWYYYARAGRYNLAIDHYSLALKFDPEFVSTYMNYCQVLIDTRRFEEAIKVAEAGMKIPGTDNDALWNEVGRCNEMLGRYREAIRAYNRAWHLSMNRDAMETIRGNANRVRAKRRHLAFGWTGLV